MPEGTKRMFIVHLTVIPNSQSQDVGGALFMWGTDAADDYGLLALVDSSEAAWYVYEKFGLEVKGTLDVG